MSHWTDFSEAIVRDKAFDDLLQRDYGAKHSGASGDMFIPWPKLLRERSIAMIGMDGNVDVWM